MIKESWHRILTQNCHDQICANSRITAPCSRLKHLTVLVFISALLLCYLYQLHGVDVRIGTYTVELPTVKFVLAWKSHLRNTQQPKRYARFLLYPPTLPSISSVYCIWSSLYTSKKPGTNSGWGPQPLRFPLRSVTIIRNRPEQSSCYDLMKNRPDSRIVLAGNFYRASSGASRRAPTRCVWMNQMQ